RQFSLSARSRLARHEIGALLKALRRLDGRMQQNGKVVATSGEIVRAEQDFEFERESATDDTRVKTAISWLEESHLLSREENRVQVFPASLNIGSIDEAKAKLDSAGITGTYRKALRAILRHIIVSDPDQGVSTDELTGLSGLSPQKLSRAMSDLESLDLLRNDMIVTAFVHLGVKDASQRRLEKRSALERDLIDILREVAPDADQGGEWPLNLSATVQTLRDKGHEELLPDMIERLLRGLSRDGRDQDGGKGSLRLRKPSRNALMITLQRSWSNTGISADKRRRAAATLLGHLLGKLDKGSRGKDLKVETTMGALKAALAQDLLLAQEARDMEKLMQRALLWLHEQEIVTLGKGLSIFRSAMTVHLNPKGGQFTKEDFAPLNEHYEEQTLQTHVMAAYAKEGLGAMSRANKLATDYFELAQPDFLKLWMPGRPSALRRQTTEASYEKIVGQLRNPVQERIVSDDREQTNMLVLAGPGSGKTRVLVHRIAYLARVRRENPRGILVLSYNRHAAAEIRVRLRHLIGDDARRVTVSTCHALAMRLVGASFTGLSEDARDFDEVVLEAARLLRGEGLSRAEAEAQREALIQGYRWILVDEYQDIGPAEYELIAAVAGRTQEDP
ncbi:MAG: UvrD-helicase domain-containing protein, partial [Mangrovicoccus sp.]